ncbi:tyrosine-protein phosphatase [Amycolatopsis roodepoortensis]|uniref:tyrosine-protein phosphatase n=1 Tax=Amycolatopsis roodepoortensis TaxID=700274 RepID=UPI00214C23E4|nr:tyrosine-protein phosphatase [Amycolatopsis roodepoortensis]UUV36177.1 tyrosine-protein phosphatase [Amycolatopsis roodepoortensis]
MGWLPNGRDLGGLPSADGRRVRCGALFRSDSHNRLTTDGIAAVHGARIGRVLDLRGNDRTPEHRAGRTRHDRAGPLPNHARRNPSPDRGRAARFDHRELRTNERLQR